MWLLSRLSVQAKMCSLKCTPSNQSWNTDSTVLLWTASLAKALGPSGYFACCTFPEKKKYIYIVYTLRDRSDHLLADCWIKLVFISFGLWRNLSWIDLERVISLKFIKICSLKAMFPNLTTRLVKTTEILPLCGFGQILRVWKLILRNMEDVIQKKVQIPWGSEL